MERAADQRRSTQHSRRPNRLDALYGAAEAKASEVRGDNRMENSDHRAAGLAEPASE
jgi:hypothetical protein